MHISDRDPRSPWSLQEQRVAALNLAPNGRAQAAATTDFFATPGALQPPEVLKSAMGDGAGAGTPGPDSIVWLVLDHRHGRCLAFCRTRAVAESWLEVYLAGGLLEAGKWSVQPCLLRGTPPQADP